MRIAARGESAEAAAATVRATRRETTGTTPRNYGRAVCKLRARLETTGVAGCRPRRNLSDIRRTSVNRGFRKVAAHKATYKKCKLNRFEGVTLQLVSPFKFPFDFKSVSNRPAFVTAFASRAKKQDPGLKTRKMHLHMRPAVSSEMLSAGGGVFGTLLAAGGRRVKHSLPR